MRRKILIEEYLIQLREKLNDALELLDNQGKTAYKGCGENAIIIHKPYFTQARNEIWESVEIIDRITGRSSGQSRSPGTVIKGY